jgi:hypothetical protein
MGVHPACGSGAHAVLGVDLCVQLCGSTPSKGPVALLVRGGVGHEDDPGDFGAIAVVV